MTKSTINHQQLTINHEGFTLIELLVVISLIGILAALALVSFASSQKQARDTQRKSDLRQYSTSLEGFANKSGGFYPAITGTRVSGLCAGTVLNLSPCPEDPKNSQDASYYYQYSSDGTAGGSNATKYVLWGKLENISNTYWAVCSTGQSGKTASSTLGSGACPSDLTP